MRNEVFPQDSTYKLAEKQIQAAESMLRKGYAVELRPVKDGIKIIKVIREQLKTESSYRLPK